MTALDQFNHAFAQCPLIAILRGLHPDQAVDIGETLVDAGFTIIEVPLNSPDPFKSISRLATALKGKAVIGAGTVYRRTEVDQVVDAGGRLIVSPHAHPDVIAHAVSEHLVAAPGVFTPTEAMTALDAGAHILKLFPGELMSPSGVKALAAVLPRATRMVLVGGVNEESFARYRSTPLAGYGLGSTLFTPNMTAHDVRARAHSLLSAYQAHDP